MAQTWRIPCSSPALDNPAPQNRQGPVLQFYAITSPKQMGASLSLKSASLVNAVVERARQSGRPTGAAEAILRTLESSLRTFERHRERIFGRLEAKRDGQ